MDMLEDYLRAVSRLLPRTKRDDIIAELRDEILTRIETKEAELGRPLTADETEQVLRDLGHPIVVAARYRDEPQYAVGPALYPFWSFAVRLIILLQIVIAALVVFGRVVAGSPIGEAIGAAIGTGLTGAMTLIGFATVAVWLIDRNGIAIDYLKTWRVRDLRFLDFTAWDWGDLRDSLSQSHTWGTGSGSGGNKTRDPDLRLRRAAASRGISSLVGAGFAFLWWTGVIRFGIADIDPATLPADFGALATLDWPAIKAALYWPVMAYIGAIFAFGVAVLVLPRAVRLRGVIDMVVGAAILALNGWLWFVSPLAPIIAVDSAQGLIDRAAAWFTIPLPVPVVSLVTFIVLFSALGGLFRILFGLWEAISGIPRPDSEG